MWIIILISVLTVLIYFKAIKPHKLWQEKKIAEIKPWPFIGNMGPLFLKQRSFAHLIQEMYNAHPNQRYCGMYQFLQPTLLVRDPELIKEIAVKNFDTFPHHQPFVPEGADPVWDKNLFGSKGGEKWYNLRTTLSPNFTGTKMKMMFGLVKNCAQQLTSYYEKQGGIVTAEMKDVFTRYITDVIATTTLGVSCDSFEHKENKVYLMAKKVAEFSGFRGLVILFGCTISPALIKLLKFKIVPPRVSAFFKDIVKESVKLREEKGIVRPDMIDLIMETRKERLKVDEDLGLPRVKELDAKKIPKRQKIEITDDDITAVVIDYFIAGLDTTSTAMSYVCYELALNPDIQKNLLDEIDKSLISSDGVITYDALLGMKYLDMVVSESFRKWPPAEFTDRKCINNFTIEPKLPNEKELHLESGINCWFPIYPIQRDPQYFPDPDRFDPERFNDDNKNNIKPFTYFPFGVGPRVCIAARFSLMITKLVVVEILKKFEFVVVEETQVPLVLEKGNLNMVTEKGIWLGMKPRGALTGRY